MEKKILIYIAIIVALFACKTKKCITNSAMSESLTTISACRIEFGSGGGFANSVKSYTLYDDGTLLEGGRVVKQLSVDSISSVFILADSIKVDYVAPGNTYQFVNIYHSSDTVFCSWQIGDKKIKPEIKVVYNKLRELL